MFPVLLTRPVALHLQFPQNKLLTINRAKNTMQKIDLRGFMVPFTLLKISNSFRTLEKEEILEILLSDRDALDDLVMIIPESAYALIKMEVLDGEDQGIRIQLKKMRGK